MRRKKTGIEPKAVVSGFTSSEAPSNEQKKGTSQKFLQRQLTSKNTRDFHPEARRSRRARYNIFTMS